MMTSMVSSRVLKTSVCRLLKRISEASGTCQ
jgi:hypothetical protein